MTVTLRWRCMLRLARLIQATERDATAAKSQIGAHKLTMAWLDLFRRNRQVLKTPEERQLERAGQVLRWAARWGNVRAVKRLVEKWGDSEIVESTNRNGRTALHVAILNKRFEIVQYLVDSAGADVEAFVRQGRLCYPERAIHMAVRTGSLKMVRYLVETAHASVEAKGPKNRTALLWAIYHRQSIDMVKYLVTSCGADVEAVDSDRHTAILLAVACNCSFQIIQYLVESCHANVRAKNIDREDAYELACNLFRSDEKKQLLFEAHRDSVERVDKDGRTLLLQAIKQHKMENVRRLVETHHANVKVTDFRGNTPLLLAVKERQCDIAEYLVASTRVDVEARDLSGIDALSLAVERGEAEMVFLLAKSGRCTVSTAIIYREAQYNNCKVVQALIESGAVNVDVTNSTGDTILHAAVINERFDMVKCLVKCNANVEAKLSHGGTALHSAIEYGRSNEMVRYLVEEGGANVEATNAVGDTALILSVRTHRGIDVEHMQYLVESTHANANALAGDGQRVLNVAVRNQFLTELNICCLVERDNANVEGTNVWGETPLFTACQSGRVDLVQWLIRAGQANIVTMNDERKTVFHDLVVTSLYGILDSWKILRYLIEWFPVQDANWPIFEQE